MSNEKLFSYGTLCDEMVQLATFGRKLVGQADILEGYKLSQLKITDQNVISTSGKDTHPILIPTNNKNDKINGMVFDISIKELELTDKYEVSDYRRTQVILISGIHAWVYVYSPS